MNTDMTGIGSDYTLVGSQHGVNDGSVGLRAAYEEKYIRVRGMTGVSNPVPGTFTDII